MGKKKDPITIKCVGGSSLGVTGSCYLLETKNKKILIECGLIQGNKTLLEDYKANSKNFDFKPTQIDYILVGHLHADHVASIPRLYKENCFAKIIAPLGTKEIYSVMQTDSAFIMSKDAIALTKQKKKIFEPIYSVDDVNKSLEYWNEYIPNEKHFIDENLTIRFVPSGHILKSYSIEIWVTEGNKTYKIYYSSDIGNITVPKYYIEPFQKVESANLAILETTYCDKTRKSISLKTREKDLEKIKQIIKMTCEEKNGKVLIPIFSYDRLQNILTYIYQLFKEEKFNYPVIVGTPLGCKISNVYSKVLEGEEKKLFNQVRAWENVKEVKTFEDCKFYLDSKEPCVFLAAAGMLQAGYSKMILAKLLPNTNNHIITVGFSAENTLGNKIRNNKQKTITIDGKSYLNKCSITNLNSFSSHIQRDSMLKLYSDCNYGKILLVHGEKKAQKEFAEELKKELEKKNKTTSVVVSNYEMLIKLQ